MEQHPIFYLLLGIVLVGVAVGVGYFMFSYHSMAANKEALVSDLYHISSNAYQYASRPTTMGGGSGAFMGYAVPPRLRESENGSFQVIETRVSSKSKGLLKVLAASRKGYGSVTMLVDDDHRSHEFTFSGEFR